LFVKGKEKTVFPKKQILRQRIMKTNEDQKGAKKAQEASEKPILRNVRRVLPGKKKGMRLRPFFDILVDNNMSIAELARRCGMAKQSMSTRFAVDDCRCSDMEEMAEALGYKFVWYLEPKEEETEA
jgi:hypothetical protein